VLRFRHLIVDTQLDICYDIFLHVGLVKNLPETMVGHIYPRMTSLKRIMQLFE
jgi:hypothetical protein